jgi:hypothetical protein
MATREEITQVYVSTFNRAPDADGLEYWYQSGLAIEEISASFFDQEETKEMYPTTMNNQTFVTAIYNNVFNHDPDSAGFDYWVEELDSKNISRANMILAIGNGATGTDKDILDNKTEVGIYYAGRELNSPTEATQVMDGVDETSQSLSDAKSYINSITNFDFTVETDTIKSGFLDDIMHGQVFSLTPTYSVGDSMDGGDGDDTLVLSMGLGGKDPVATLRGVETLKLLSLVPTADHQINASNWKDIDNFEILNSQATTIINNINDPFDSITLDGLTTTVITSLVVTDNIFTSSYDSVDLIVSGTSLSTVARVGISNSKGEGVVEEFNITSQNNSGTIANDNESSLSISPITDTKTININGDSDIALLTSGGNNISRVDALGLEAGLRYTVTGTDGTKVLGGTKGDVLTALVDGDVLDGGKGADRLISLAAADTKQTFAYNDKGDSGTTTTTADTIIGFETTVDKLTFNNLDAGSTTNFHNSSTIANTLEEAVMASNSGELMGYTYLFYANITDSFLVIDADEDGQADQAIILSGVTIFSADDIA